MANRIYFTSIGSDSKYNLWVSDGTTAGTTRVGAVNVGAAGQATKYFASLNGQPYFEGFESTVRAGLFTVNAAGVLTQVNTPAGWAAGLSPTNLIAFNGKLYFGGRDVNGEYGLFTSDGTGAGTVRLAVPGASGNFYVSTFTRFGNRLAFSGTVGTFDNAVYLTDGTANGTTKLTLTGPGSFLFSISTMAVAGGRLVFAGRDINYKSVIWTSDGTSAGSSRLVVPGLNPIGDSTPTGMISFGAKAAFTAVDAVGNVCIWVTDGTAAGTAKLPSITVTSDGTSMVALPNGRLAFIGTGTDGIRGVFVTDGTTTTQVQVPGSASTTLNPNGLMALGGLLMFDGTTPNGLRALFRSDGTSAGTTVLQSGINLVGGNVDADVATVGGVPSVVALSPGGTLSSAGSVVIGTAAGSVSGDGLTVSLLSDKAFASGSSVTVNAQNQVVYTAGTVTAANAGTDVINYRVTDAVTGQTVDGSGTVILAVPPAVPVPASPTVPVTVPPTASVTVPVVAPKPARPPLGFVNGTSHESGVIEMAEAGKDGPSYLEAQHIYAGSDDVAFSTQTPNVFIHSGSGNDAIQVTSGRNVLDGGLGSNFETGGSGIDTFFTDARAPGVVWNTLRNFHAGDAATLWGFTAGTSSYRWEAQTAGAAGFEGATLRANIVGGAGRTGDGIDASITFTGLSVEQARGLQIVTGKVSAGDYLYIYNPGV